MPDTPESTLLHYRLLEKLGEGGMGVVWKAADTSLDREVAVKILPEAFARETDRLARFEREAKTLAALNHPGIAAVYGLHEDKGIRFLAMELARGEELLRILKRGPLPVDEALKIGAEIARALEAAHDVGVIHRDLKPANIMIGPGGGVKLLDFGLAKSFEADPSSGGGSMTPTLTTPATRAGVIMGTAAYMSPEQARGKPVDKRADIWAFGVILWEMLAGRRAFQGETVSDTLASVLKESPDLDALPSSTPPAVRHLISRCLEKDPSERLRDIGEARILLSGDPGAGIPGAGEHFPSPGSTSRTAPAALTVAAVALASLLAGTLASWLLLTGPSGPGGGGPTMRLSIPVPRDRPVGNRLSRPVAISPAGDRVVYVGVVAGGSQIFSRRMDAAEFEAIPGTVNCFDPFFSPDGRSLGYMDQSNSRLKFIDFDAMVRATDLVQTPMVGAVWSENGFIYYTPAPVAEAEASSSIHRVPAVGGEPEPVTSVEAGSNEIHMWPEILPGGKTLIYAVVRNFDFGGAELRAHDLESGREKVLVPNGQLARYVESGHLVYLQGDALLASRFDPSAVELQGSPKAVLSGVMTNPDSGSAAFAVSRDGTLVYVRGEADSALYRISGFDLEGHPTPLVDEPADYLGFRVAPDGTRIAVATQEGPGRSDVWVHDIRRRTFSRLTTSSAGTGSPTWSPDGTTIYYATYESAGASQLMKIRADGSGDPEIVVSLAGFSAPLDVSPDGRWLLYLDSGGAGSDLRMISLTEEGENRPFLATESNETSGRISPDGRYAAYVDDSMDRREVFIRSFPSPGEAWRVSTSGGEAPAWSPDGREIFYLQGEEVMAVSLGTSDEPRPGRPRKLFPTGLGILRSGLQSVTIDTLPDGTLVLFQPVGRGSSPTRIEVITNWFGSLDKLVP